MFEDARIVVFVNQYSEEEHHGEEYHHGLYGEWEFETWNYGKIDGPWGEQCDAEESDFEFENEE